MKQQSGMLLLEVLLAMAIFATAIIALLNSMQWQLSALETFKTGNASALGCRQRTRDLDLRTTRRQRGSLFSIK